MKISMLQNSKPVNSRRAYTSLTTLHNTCTISIKLIDYPFGCCSIKFSCSKDCKTLRATDDDALSKWHGLEPRRFRPKNNDDFSKSPINPQKSFLAFTT